MLRVRNPRLGFVLSFSLALIAGPGLADPVPPGPWAVSVFAGVLTKNGFSVSLYTPGHFSASYLAGTDVTYTYHSFRSFPLKLELDVSAAKRFGQDNQWDFGIVPTFRWTKFPWNNHLYTNFRIGPIGVDYVTGISPWELHWSGGSPGSRFLNYFLIELDFKKSEMSPLEAYVGWHHRSGAWGLWNRTYGGSTYEMAGLRYHF